VTGSERALMATRGLSPSVARWYEQHGTPCRLMGGCTPPVQGYIYYPVEAGGRAFCSVPV